MAQTRIRKGVSLGPTTVATLDAMVASGVAESVSAAIDLTVNEYRRRRADADLVAAAGGLDVGHETDLPGVLGSTPHLGPDDDRDGPSWASVAP